MNTKINLTYNETKYTLEFNRDVVKMLEQSGFKLDEFLDKPMTNIELVFSGAFLVNHKNITQTTIDSIFNSLKNKQGLIVELQKMVRECYDSLLDDSEVDEGNATWEVVDLSPKTSQK